MKRAAGCRQIEKCTFQRLKNQFISILISRAPHSVRLLCTIRWKIKNELNDDEDDDDVVK